MKERLTYAFEGLDGAGKTTNIRLLSSHFRQQGVKVAVVGNPSREAVGVILRKNIGNIEFSRVDALFLYDIKRTTRGIPSDTEIVLWDRHIDSLYTSNSKSKLSDIEQKAIGIPRPDRVFLLDIPIDLAWEREMTVSDHPINYEWLVQKYERYRELLALYPKRIEKINANKPLEEVFRELVSVISSDYLRQRVMGG